MGTMTWRMGVGVGVDMVAGAVMVGRVMGVEVRRPWAACILGAKEATAIIGSIIGIIRGVGAGRGGLTGAAVKGRKRSMSEEVDDVDEIWLGWVGSGVCGMVRSGSLG